MGCRGRRGQTRDRDRGSRRGRTRARGWLNSCHRRGDGGSCMSENIQSENTVKIDIEEVKKPGWEHGKASSGPLPGHGGTDLRDAVIKLEPGWTPQVASGGILAGPGSRP